MCKHVLNAKVHIKVKCCPGWWECRECHDDVADHAIEKDNIMTIGCKTCKKVFRKDATDFDETDKYCPRCDTKYIIPALTPQAALEVEGEDVRIDSRMLKDDRVRRDMEKSIFNWRDVSDRLG